MTIVRNDQTFKTDSGSDLRIVQFSNKESKRYLWRWYIDGMIMGDYLLSKPRVTHLISLY